MGPKNQDKQSKKQKAEERKRILEEELKQQAIKEEKIRLKKEAEERAAALLIEKKERKFRVVELEELREILLKLNDDYKEKTKLRREKKEWERYLLCDGSPNPCNLPEINTYMNLWREDEKRIQIDDVFDESRLCLRLIDEISDLLDDIADQAYPEMNKKQLKESKQELIELMQAKLDRASYELLKTASALADSITANLQVTYKSSQFSLCIWGNLSKNPRIKEFEFSEEGIGFDIPKVIRLSDVAVRILFLSYDPYSSHAGSYVAKQIEKEISTVVCTEPQGDDQKTDLEEAQNKEDEKTNEPENVMESINEMLRASQEEDEAKNQKEEEKVEEEETPAPPEDLVPTPEPPEYESYDGPISGINLREYQVVGGVFIFELLILPEQPKTVDQWTMYKSIFPSELVRFEYSPYKVEEADPTPVEETPIENDPNACTEAVGEGEGAVVQEKEAVVKPNPQSVVETAAADKERDDSPVLVKFKISPTLQILEDTPKLGYWDSNEREWCSEGVSIKSYNISTREIIFTTRQFGVFALFQDFHINFPFQSWSIRPYGEVNVVEGPPDDTSAVKSGECDKIAEQENQSSQGFLDDVYEIEEKHSLSQISAGDSTKAEDLEDAGIKLELSRNHCVVQILSAIHEVTIEVLMDRVRVVENLEKPELNFLCDKWFTVPQLIRTMRFYGINIFPREDSLHFVGVLENDIAIKAPNPLLESRLYEQIALLSPSVAFSSCLWNRENRTNGLCYICSTEHLSNEPVDETQWSVYEVTRKKVVKLAINNYSKKFSRNLAPDLNFHAELYHMYQEECSDIGRERVTNIDKGYLHTVTELLKSIRMITFCQ